MIGGCSHFGLRSLQHLLVATIDQLRNLRTNQVAGIGENPDALFSIFLDRRRHVVLPQEHTSLSARRFDQVEAMIAKPLYGIFESSLFYFSCHFSPESAVCHSWLVIRRRPTLYRIELMPDTRYHCIALG